MALHPSANPANLRRSWDAYVAAALPAGAFPAGFAAANLIFPGSSVDPGALGYFVRVSYAELLREEHRETGEGRGYLVTDLLTVEVVAKRAGYDVIAPAKGLALVRPAFTLGAAIPLRDYEGGGAEVFGHSVVERLRPPSSDFDAVWLSAMLEVELSRVEIETT